MGNLYTWDGFDWIEIGVNGTNGVDGDSAYEIWISQGNVGTEQDFLDSLAGDPGADGIDGTDGAGLITGGTANQILVKQSGTDYDADWEDLILGKPTDAYAISNTEDAGTYKYFGFENKDGAWYILRKTVATNIYLYTYGASAYATGWTNRASHSYDTYENTF